MLAKRRNPGFTLMELVIVVAILAVLAGLVLPASGDLVENTQDQATQISLSRIRDAILGTPQNPGYYADVGSLPEFMADLFEKPPGVDDFNINTHRGWNGQYILPNGKYQIDNARNFTITYERQYVPAKENAAFLDVWGSPIVIQKPEISGWTDAQELEYVRLVSAGPDKIINTKLDDPTAVNRGDDQILFLRRADVP